MRVPRLVPVNPQGLCCLHPLTPLLRAPKVTDAQVEGPGLPWEVGRGLDGVRPTLKGLVDPGVEVPGRHVVAFVDHCSVTQHVQVGVLGRRQVNDHVRCRRQGEGVGPRVASSLLSGLVITGPHAVAAVNRPGQGLPGPRSLAAAAPTG